MCEPEVDMYILIHNILRKMSKNEVYIRFTELLSVLLFSISSKIGKEWGK